MRQKNKKRTSVRYKFLKMLNGFLALVLAVMLAATAFAHMLMNRMNHTDGSLESMSPEEVQDYLSDQQAESDVDAPTVNENDVNWGEKVDTLLGDSDHVVNILLIGQDRREGESRARSDSMILVTVNTKTKEIVLTSFLRDLYVQIPGFKSNRLNASYAWGGMELLNDTLEQNFGIHVDGNVEVDFNQFARIVDMLGGVEIELRSDEAKLINKEAGGNLSGGLQTLKGKETLAYTRIRKLDTNGDFSRTERQRKVIGALLTKVRKSDLFTLLGVVKDVLPMVTTDMTNTEILGYATSMFPLLSGGDMSNQRIPADGTYQYATVSGMSVLLADMDANREILQKTLGD